MKWLVLALTYLMGALSLIGVFAMYLQPEFVFNLAQQVWSCF
jgi:predicted DNA repair protein MutK